MDVKSVVLKYKDEIIKDLINISAIRSVRGEAKEGMPAGAETAKALEYMMERARRMGFKTVNTDGYMGYASFGSGKDYIAVIGHLDVVPEGTGWKHDPFGGEIEDGKIYGRGTIDNKGPSVAALYALKVIKDMGAKGTKEVRALFGTMEESGMEDIRHYLVKNPEPVAALVPDAGYPIYNKQRGLYVFEVSCPVADSRIVSMNGGERMNVVPGEAFAQIAADTDDIDRLKKTARDMCGKSSKIYLEEQDGMVSVRAEGKKGSTSYGRAADNANLLLLEFLVKTLGEDAGKKILYIQDLFKRETDCRLLGLRSDGDEFGHVSVGLCKMSIEKGTAKFLVDIRFPVNQKLIEIQRRIRDVFEGFELEDIKAEEAHYVPEDGELCTILSDVYSEHTGDKTQYLCNLGMNYSRYIKNGVAFGSGFLWDEPSPSHGADEFIQIESLLENCTLYAKALMRLMK